MEVVIGFSEIHDPEACDCPEKCPLSPQFPKESLELTGTGYQGPGTEKQVSLEWSEKISCKKIQAQLGLCKGFGWEKK